MSLPIHAASAPAGEILLVALEISHSTLATPLRYVLDVASWTLGGAPYTAAGFDTEAAAADDSGVDSRSLSIDDQDRVLFRLLQALRGNTELVRVTIREFLSTDLEHAVSVAERDMARPTFDPRTGVLAFSAETPNGQQFEAPITRFTINNSPGLVR